MIDAVDRTVEIKNFNMWESRSTMKSAENDGERDCLAKQNFKNTAEDAYIG